MAVHRPVALSGSQCQRHSHTSPTSPTSSSSSSNTTATIISYRTRIENALAPPAFKQQRTISTPQTAPHSCDTLSNCKRSFDTAASDEQPRKRPVQTYSYSANTSPSTYMKTLQYKSAVPPHMNPVHVHQPASTPVSYQRQLHTQQQQQQQQRYVSFPRVDAQTMPPHMSMQPLYKTQHQQPINSNVLTLPQHAPPSYMVPTVHTAGAWLNEWNNLSSQSRMTALCALRDRLTQYNAPAAPQTTAPVYHATYRPTTVRV